MSSFGLASKAAFAPWLAAVIPVTAVVAAIQSLSSAKSGQQSSGNPFGITAPFLQGDPTGAWKTPWGTIPDTPVQTKNPVKALGGNVLAGVAYTVGERGRELFTPQVPGYITPNNQLGNGGGHTFNNYFYGTNVTADEVARKISWQLKTAAV
jgi:hypothetical protein